MTNRRTTYGEAAHRGRERLPRVADHRGRGPRGYTRSDERIREEICECLAADSLLDASDIEVKVMEGDVSLAGSVGDRAARRRAEDLTEQVSGVRNVINGLRVVIDRAGVGERGRGPQSKAGVVR